MSLLDALLGQDGVSATGGGVLYSPQDDNWEVRFTEDGTAYNANASSPLIQGHTKANQPMFATPEPQATIAPQIETLDLGTPQVVQPLQETPQPIPQTAFPRGAEEFMAQNQQATIAPWQPEQTDYTNARDVMSAYQGGERLAQRDTGTFQDLTPKADPSKAMEMLAMFKKEGKALTDLQFEKAMDSLGMSDVLEENRSTLNTVDKHYQDSVYGNTDDFGNPLNTDDFGNANYDQRVDNYTNSLNNMTGINDVERVANVAPQEPSWLQKNQDITKQSQDFVRNLGGNIAEGATDLYEGAKELGANAYQGAQDLYSDFNEPDTRTQMEKLYDTERNITTPLRNAITDTASSALEGYKDADRYVTGKMIDGYNAVGDTYNDLLSSDKESYKSESSFGETLLTGAENFAESGAGEIEGIMQAISNPLETADAIGSLISGAVQHALPDDMSWNEESKDMASAVADIYAERYGSVEGFKKSFAEDPVPVLLELTGAGLITKLAAAKSLSALKGIEMGQAVENFSDKAIEMASLGTIKDGGRMNVVDDGLLGQTSKDIKFDNSEDFIKASIFSEARDSTTRNKLRKSFDGIKEVESTDILEPNAKNPKLDDSHVNSIEMSIESGDRPYILVDGEKVIDGHHRLQAYKNLGFDEVPVVQKSKAIESFYNPSKVDDGVLGQVKDPMIVHHNLSSEALKKHSEHGGDMAMPSLGVSKHNAPFGVTRDTTFGEISLLGDKSLIDPKKSNTYSSDAYTGRSPREMVEFDKDVEAVKDALGADTLKFHNRALYDKGLDSPEWLAVDLKIQELLEARGYNPEDYRSFASMKRQATEDLGVKEVSYITVEATRNPVELGKMKRFMLLESGGKKEFTPESALKEMRKQKAYMKGTEKELGDVDFLHSSKARALTSKKYQSLGDIMSERGRVQNRNQFDHLETGFDNMFANTIDKIDGVLERNLGKRRDEYKAGGKQYIQDLNRQDTLNIIESMLIDGTFPKWINLGSSEKAQIKQLIKPLQQMGEEMPTGYFESKPNRIVNIGEFKSAIIPKGDVQSKKRLKDMGIENIIEYDNQKEYLDAFKKNPELFFSKAIIPAGGLLGEDAINVEASEDEPMEDGILNNVKSWKPNNKLTNFVKMMENAPLAIGKAKVKAYDDVGHQAKGFGTKAGLLAEDTPEEATKALITKLIDAHTDVDRLVKIELNEDERNALVSLVFNVGEGNFANSNALKALNKGDKKTFLKEAFDPKIGFVKSDGKVLKGLVNRRAREKQIFTKGNYGN